MELWRILHTLFGWDYVAVDDSDRVYVRRVKWIAGVPHIESANGRPCSLKDDGTCQFWSMYTKPWRHLTREQPRESAE